MGNKNNEYNTRMAKFVDKMNLPKDVLLGVPIITSVGFYELHIQHYKSIIEYTSEIIKLQAKRCNIAIVGKKLCIEYYSSDEMKVKGHILEIKYY